MGIRKTILSRIALVYFVLVVFGVVVLAKIFSVQQIHNDRWQQIEQNLNSNTVKIPPVRGAIKADDGSVLATSVPGYLVRIDLAAQGVKRVFDQECDSLAYYLSAFYKDASKQSYLRKLKSAYNNGNRGLLLTPRKIDYNQLQEFKRFPILRRGRFGGGMIIEQENKRINPLGILALRTIGSMNKTNSLTSMPVGHNGLERAYQNYLKGEEGISYKQNISGRWVERTEIEPQNGADVITNINVKMQDITESALHKQLLISRAEWATAVLMEVKTGEIKAIANLGMGKNGYYEKDNYALGYRGCYEPGSTFKLVSLIVALEDGVVDTSDVYDTGNGYWAKEKITDDHACGKVNVKQILEQSSNIGTAKVILENYSKNPRDYVDRIYSFGIHKPIGLALAGEGQPYIKYPGNSDWWGTTLGRMSYGYDLRITPLQILTFYNAVANNGAMVKPQLVREIKDNGVLVKRYKTEYINPMIASGETIAKAQAMLMGVCENGTGRGVQGPNFKVAGKTGTARVARDDGKGYVPGAYYASFVGYFPADDPAYSLIVTFKKPQNSIYGAGSAGPVFKEISEKVYASQILKSLKDDEKDNGEGEMPLIKSGRSEDILKIANNLNLECVKGVPASNMTSVVPGDDEVVLKDKQITEGVVPDVRGMGASNAVFLMENAGLKVKISGVGKVKKQSLTPGSKYRSGQTVYLALS